LSRFLGAVRIARSLRKYTIRKQTQLRGLKQMMNDRYLELAHEQEQARSVASREADPVLPEDLHQTATRTDLGKQGMFLSPTNVNYAFIYKIFKHYEMSEANPRQDPNKSPGGNETNVRYSWSIFVKVRGRVHAIWQYHRFSDDMVEGVAAHDGCGDPLTKLAGLFKQIAKGAADLVLAEANKNKASFVIEDVGPHAAFAEVSTDVSHRGIVSLSQSQLERWEDEWMFNFRQ